MKRINEAIASGQYVRDFVYKNLEGLQNCCTKVIILLYLAIARNAINSVQGARILEIQLPILPDRMWVLL